MSPFMREKKGVFMLWIEVELAWGLVHRKKIDLTRLKNVSVRAREVLDDVIGLLEKYRVPVTWTVVGHLLLDHCNKYNTTNQPHPDMPRPNHSWLKEDWYRYDPCTNIQSDPAWYGKDIMDRIVKYVREGELHHDIGCHSFSHQLFGDPECTEKLAAKEIEKCLELLSNCYHIVPRVFAFPRDYVGHLDLLKKFKFVAFRDVPTKLYPCLKMERTISNITKTYLSLLIQFLSYYFLYPPHVVTSGEARPSLWAFPGCLAYNKKTFIPLRLVTVKAMQGIDRAAREGKIFSMYTHLRNFAEYECMLSEFENVLAHVDKKRNVGSLQVKTPIELAAELSSKQPLSTSTNTAFI